MVSPPGEVIIPGFPLQSSSTSPLSGGVMFLPHRPASAGIDSITQGFRFSTPGRKHPTVGAGVQEEATGNNDMARRVSDGNPGICVPDRNGIEALKVAVPIFTSTRYPLSHISAHPPLTSNPGVAAPFSMREEQMLPPSPAPHLREKRRNSSVKEKRKRVDSSSSLRSDSGGCDRSGHGSTVTQADDGTRDARAREMATRTMGRRVEISETRTPSHERGPKKKMQGRLVGLSRSPNGPPPSGNSSMEVIVLDDDIKVESLEGNTLIPEQQGEGFGDGHDMGTAGSVQGSKKCLQNEKFQVHMDQPGKHQTLQPKESDRRIGARPDTLNGRGNSSNSHLGAGVGGVSGQFNVNNRPSVSNDGALKKKGSGNMDHAVGNPSQKFGSKATLPPFNSEQGQSSSSGEHKLLMALTALTTEKQSLENKLHETMSSLKTQVFRTEISERKNSEFEAQVNTYRNSVSGLKKRILGIQKFVGGLGKDYDMLNEKKTQLNNRLNELSRDRTEFLKSLQDVRSLAEKTDGIVQEWGNSGVILKEAYREVEKLHETLKFLHAQLSENAGLLAAERDRTQSLECQIQDDRERNKVVLAAIQGGKVDIVQKLIEIREVAEKSELDLAEKLIETQKDMEARIEARGEATRNLVCCCLKSIETLRGKDIDTAECLLGMEKKVTHTSDCIMGLFHETHKMNAEALSFTDGYTSHLNSRIMDLESELKELHEKYEVSLVVTVEKGQLEKELESKLEAALKKCDEMNSKVEKGKTIESALNESISLLNQKLNIPKPQPIEDSSVVEIIKTLEQRNCDLEKECELARNSVHDASLSLQIKGTELENLRIELEILAMKHKEAEEKIERFAKERKEYMAHAEEQKMKERIEVETNANMFRQRETSRLNNQIKALEAQKGRLEVENRELKSTAAGETHVTVGLRKEIAQFNKKYADIQTSNFELLQEKARLEKMVIHLTLPGTTARMDHLAVEKLVETTTDEHSKVLGKTNVLQHSTKLKLQGKYTQEQELEYARSEKQGFEAATESSTVPRTTKRKLREILDEVDDEERAVVKGKGGQIHAYIALENTMELEKTLEVLGAVDRNSNTVEDRHGELGLTKNDTEEFRGEGEVVNENGGLPRISPGNIEIARFERDSGTEEEIPEAFRMTVKKVVTPRENSPSLSPLTPPERIFETQIGHDMQRNTPGIDNTNYEFKDGNAMDTEAIANEIPEPRRSEIFVQQIPDFPAARASRIKGIKKGLQDSQPRKNLATKFTKRRPPSTMLYSYDDETMIENFSDDAVEVNASLSRSYYPGGNSPTPFSPRVRTMGEKDGKGLEDDEGMLAERYIPNPVRPPDKPKTPLRNAGSQVEPTDDGKKIQYRTRKEHGKKNKDDQEWKEDGNESQRNNKGKEEAPNVKKNFRSYKERKKGGKRFL